jgi:hypothetical protein
VNFVDAAKTKGASDEFLVNLLTRRGWPADDVYSVLTSHWERATGLSLPERRGSAENSRDAFLYLLAFSTLSTWACALGSMLFQLIDHWFPDSVSNAYLYTNLRSSVSWQMAGIAVSFPIFLLTMRSIVKEAEEHPDRLQSGVRKWLTYIALLITAGTVIGDLIWILAVFLQGEITTRFLLKAVTVLSICGGIFAYYMGSLRQKQGMAPADRNRGGRFAFGAAAVVIASLATGFSLTGTPSKQRLSQADVKRTENLRTLAQGVKTWNDVRHQMPSSLEELEQQGFSKISLADPETKRPYEYQLEQGTSFLLCATFATSSETEMGSPFWRHLGGRSCYTFDAARPIPW